MKMGIKQRGVLITVTFIIVQVLEQIKFKNGNLQRLYTFAFKGIYYKLNPKNYLSNHIYPVPNLIYLLGVHFTRSMDGSISGP